MQAFTGHLAGARHPLLAGLFPGGQRGAASVAQGFLSLAGDRAGDLAQPTPLRPCAATGSGSAARICSAGTGKRDARGLREKVLFVQLTGGTAMDGKTFPARTGQPAVTVDVVIFRLDEAALNVLLIQRAFPPFKGKWALPGGFVNTGETLEKAALREMEEETGVRNVYLEQLYTFGDPRRDPRGRVVTIAYFALISKDVEIRAGEEAARAAWHPVGILPDLAFDHAEILRYAIQRLRSKLEYSAVGFELLPDEFTLSELQAAYETVLAEKLDKRNFRSRILGSGILTATRHYRPAPVQGRPARLYRYRKSAAKETKARRLFP
jgi:8-oxo-dGTP diphosphatase